MVVIGINHYQKTVLQNSALKRLIELKCFDLANNLTIMLMDRCNKEYWDNYFYPKIQYPDSCFTLNLSEMFIQT